MSNPSGIGLPSLLYRRLPSRQGAGRWTRLPIGTTRVPSNRPQARLPAKQQAGQPAKQQAGQPALRDATPLGRGVATNAGLGKASAFVGREMK